MPCSGRVSERDEDAAGAKLEAAGLTRRCQRVQVRKSSGCESAAGAVGPQQPPDKNPDLAVPWQRRRTRASPAFPRRPGAWRHQKRGQSEAVVASVGVIPLRARAQPRACCTRRPSFVTGTQGSSSSFLGARRPRPLSPPRPPRSPRPPLSPRPKPRSKPPRSAMRCCLLDCVQRGQLRAQCFTSTTYPRRRRSSGGAAAAARRQNARKLD